MTGKLTIDLEYGGLKTGVISGSDKEIKVGFGSAVITSIETGNVRCSYSNLSIDKAGTIDVSNQFDKTSINTVHDLKIEQKYGDLKIGTAGQLKGNVQYANLVVDKLLKSAQITLKYSSSARFEFIGPAVNNLSISSEFSNLFFHFDNNASLAGDVTISNGNLSNNTHNVKLSPGRTMPGTSPNKALIGSGYGSLSLNVSYGNLVME